MADNHHFSERPFKPPAPGRGACVVSNSITVAGQRVGYMYRREPAHATDSGWVFLGGQETQETMDDSRNFAVCDVNEIANLDPDIMPFLDAPAGSALGRDPESGQFEPEFAPEEAFAGPDVALIPGAGEFAVPGETPPAPIPPAQTEEQDTPDFCDNCGAPLEIGEAEIRSKTETTLAGAVPFHRAVNVALCPRCAHTHDGTGDRMIWGMGAFVAAVVLIGLAAWILPLLFR
jgi:hypothetical protein